MSPVSKLLSKHKEGFEVGILLFKAEGEDNLPRHKMCKSALKLHN